MDSPSKDDEVRARVTHDIYTELLAIAESRGEKLPVIIREALAEYLANRLSTQSPQQSALAIALKDSPSAIDALIRLGEALQGSKKVSYGEAMKKARPSKKDTESQLMDKIQEDLQNLKGTPPKGSK